MVTAITYTQTFCSSIRLNISLWCSLQVTDLKPQGWDEDEGGEGRKRLRKALQGGTKPKWVNLQCESRWWCSLLLSHNINGKKALCYQLEVGKLLFSQNVRWFQVCNKTFFPFMSEPTEKALDIMDTDMGVHLYIVQGC